MKKIIFTKHAKKRMVQRCFEVWLQRCDTCETCEEWGERMAQRAFEMGNKSLKHTGKDKTAYFHEGMFFVICEKKLCCLTVVLPGHDDSGKKVNPMKKPKKFKNAITNKKRLKIIGLSFFFLINTAFAQQIPEGASWYNPKNDQIYIHPDADQFTIEHEQCHRRWFWNLTEGQRNRWHKEFFKPIPFCYSDYAFTYGRTFRASIECFADVCSFFFGNEAPVEEQQYWFGENPKKSPQFLFIHNLFTS